jgi:hypothetical protein
MNSLFWQHQTHNTAAQAAAKTHAADQATEVKPAAS